MPPADRGGSASVLGRIHSPHSSGRPAEQLGQTDALAAEPIGPGGTRTAHFFG